MITAPELQLLTAAAAVWQRYDPAVKADLWSSALRTAAGIYLIDPTEVDRASLDRFVDNSPIAGIVVTNENHVRDAPTFSATLEAPLLTSSAAFPPNGLITIELPGAPAGEIALISPNGELVLGDALINFEPHGFTFLPDSYCTDARQMRKSLRKLLDHTFERILFAHGTPITRKARSRLESLLASKI